ncbi:MAG: hypothetical protein J6C82_04915 [Clostridia bacterium]|nr:hypothetical protein [Clostridia bacterium]
MNILTDMLPSFVCINGTNYPINTDFRVWIKVTQAFVNRCSDGGQIGQLFFELFNSVPNEPVEDIMKALFEFYNPPSKMAAGNKNEAKKRQFDYDYDDELIYAGFLQQYNIDLTATNLHWWKFKALMNNLGESTQFAKVVGYRAMDLSEIKDKEQRKWYAKMKRLYRLPDNRTEEEKERDFCDAIAGVF